MVNRSKCSTLRNQGFSYKENEPPEKMTGLMESKNFEGE